MFAQSRISNSLADIFLIYDSGRKGIQRPFLWQSKLFLRKCSVCLIYLWVSSGVLRRVGITGITPQPSVFRLHVALIDFSPSLLRCTINQYSNKSSFILEKCSFQLSRHEVLVSSMRRWERGIGLHLASGLICPVRDTWLCISVMTAPYINIKSRHCQEKKHFKCTLVFMWSFAWFSTPSGPKTAPYWYLYCVFSFRPTVTTLWWMKAMPWRGGSAVYEALFSQGHTFNVKQQPEVISIHHCQQFHYGLHRRNLRG